MLSLKCIEKHIAPFIPAVIRQLSTKSRFSFASSDPYVILGLDKTATKKQIKKQYYSLAKRYHPDLNPGNEAAKRMFILIQKSYEELEIRHSPKNQQTVSTEDDGISSYINRLSIFNRRKRGKEKRSSSSQAIKEFS